MFFMSKHVKTARSIRLNDRWAILAGHLLEDELSAILLHGHMVGIESADW